ncbi:hypothetical protein FRC08_011235 [Ceratobasidium sp. 394]|nr:hypothetical protein FRC08_011235 [Ceratobasidium sp. 394]
MLKDLLTYGRDVATQPVSPIMYTKRSKHIDPSAEELPPQPVYKPLQDIAKIYLDAGDPLGDLRKNSMTLTHLARRFIFKCLLPGRIRVYIDIATIDDEDTFSITYKIGPDNAKLEDIPKNLLKRCGDMFLRKADLFLRLEGPSRWEDGGLYKWRRGDKVMGLLENLDLIE